MGFFKKNLTVKSAMAGALAAGLCLTAAAAGAVSLPEKPESKGAESELSARPFVSENIPEESQARAAAAFEKLSRNQSQFAAAASPLNFKFSPEAVDRLRARLENLANLEAAQALKAELRRMRSKLQAIGDPEAVFALPLSRAFSAGRLEPKAFANPHARSPRAWRDIDVSPKWRDFPGGAGREAADFLGASPAEWFEGRARDWALLGREIMKNFPPAGELDIEAFDQLISRSIDRLAAESLQRGRLFWLSADVSGYRRYAGSRRSGAGFSENLYSERLKTDAFHILLNRPLEYKLFSLELPFEARERIRRDRGVRLEAGKSVYFPFLDTELLAEGRLRQIRSESIQLSEAARIVKEGGLNLADRGLFALRNAGGDYGSGSRLHIPPVNEHKALRRLFAACRETPLSAKSPKIEWLNERNIRGLSGGLYVYSSPAPSKGFPKLLSDPPFVDAFGRRRSLWSLPLGKSLENAFSENGQSPFCAAAMAVFRQVFLQNALSLYKKYLTGLSGGPAGGAADRDWQRLRAEELARREELEAAKSRKAEKEAALVAEKDKDSRFLALFIKKHAGWTGWGADPEKIQALEREIQDEKTAIKRAFEKRLLAEEKTIPYREYLGAAFLAAYEDLAADSESSGSLSEETASRLAFMAGEIPRREREARSRISEIERLLPLYQKDYLEARSFLAAFSFEEARGEIHREWSAALRGFFGGLAGRHQEHEEKSSQKIRLEGSIAEAEQQLAALEVRLGGSSEAIESPAPIEQAYLELKLGIISSLEEAQSAPRLEDVWAALLLRHYQEAGGASLRGFAQFLSLLDQISEAPDTPLSSFKEAYEKNLAGRRGAPLLYNREFRSLAHPLLAGRVQCYSGTMMFYAMTELGGRFSPRFALFAEGHVLPGILRWIDGKKRLYGIETTVQGAGLSDFGPASEVSGEIRVVEMYPFLLIELLKSETANFPELFAAAGESLKKFGFSPERLRPLDSDGPARTDDILNATPFGFGRSDAPSGDRLRKAPSPQSLRGFYNLRGFGAEKPERLAPDGGVSEGGFSGAPEPPFPGPGGFYEISQSFYGPPAAHDPDRDDLTARYQYAGRGLPDKKIWTDLFIDLNRRFLQDFAAPRRFLQDYAAPRGPDKKSWIALNLAAAVGEADAVERLLKEGADPNIQMETGLTALHYAALFGRAEALEILLKSGAGPNIQSARGLTALHLAAWRAADSGVWRAGGSLWTDFDFAAEAATEEAVEILLNSGADIEIKAAGGETAFDVAVIRGNKSAARILAERTGDSPKRSRRLNWLKRLKGMETH